MSDINRVLRHALTVCGAVGALAAPVVLRAQGPAAPDSVLGRIWALDSVVAVRKQTIDSMRKAIVRLIPPVAVKQGPLEVRTTLELESRVREAVALTSSVIDTSSLAMRARVASHVPVITRDSTAVVFGFKPVLAMTPDSTRRWFATMRINLSVNATPAEIADRLAMFVEQFALQGTDSALSAWVMLGRVPLRPTSGAAARDVYVELAANESAAVRRCRGGDTAACLDAMGLDSTSGSRLTRWYAPEDYRSLLHRVAPPREDSVAVAAWLRCRNDRDQNACVTAANALPDASVPFPLSANARLMLLRQAFDIGGPRAYDRLLEPRSNVRDRIESAATKPMGEVVRQWLARTEAARPNPMRVRAGSTLASLGWCGLFLAVGITGRRSCV